MVPGVVKVDLAPLHGHRAAGGYLRAEPYRVFYQFLPATVGVA